MAGQPFGPSSLLVLTFGMGGGWAVAALIVRGWAEAALERQRRITTIAVLERLPNGGRYTERSGGTLRAAAMPATSRRLPADLSQMER